MNLEENYFNKIISATNYIIDSGRGLALLWNINKVPSKALTFMESNQRVFISAIKRVWSR